MLVSNMLIQVYSLATTFVESMLDIDMIKSGLVSCHHECQSKSHDYYVTYYTENFRTCMSIRSTDIKHACAFYGSWICPNSCASCMHGFQTNFQLGNNYVQRWRLPSALEVSYSSVWVHLLGRYIVNHAWWSHILGTGLYVCH